MVQRYEKDFNYKKKMVFLLCFTRYFVPLHHISRNNIMAQQFEIIAKTFMGLEPVLAKELTQMGASDVQIGRRMVSFTGDKAMLYRANFQLHPAIRILKPIKHFKALSADDVYEGVKDIDWSEYSGILLIGKSVGTVVCAAYAQRHHLQGRVSFP